MAPRVVTETPAKTTQTNKTTHKRKAQTKMIFGLTT